MSTPDDASTPQGITNPGDSWPVTEAVVEEYLPRDTEGLEVRAGIAQQIYVVFDSIFGNGSQVTTHNLGKVDRFSSVAVSITEVDLNGNPFVARAGMQVMNVVPRDDRTVQHAFRCFEPLSAMRCPALFGAATQVG